LNHFVIADYTVALWGMILE